MESPPKLKRVLPNNSSSLAAFPLPQTDINDTSAEENQQHHFPMSSASSISTDNLHTLSLIPKTLESDENKMSNLCVFVNEVASQQQKQIDELDCRCSVLNKKKIFFHTLREKYRQIQLQQKSVKRRTYLAMEDAAVMQTKISAIRDEILALLGEERELKHDLQLMDAQSIFVDYETLQQKMQQHAEKVRLSELNIETSNEIIQTQKRIADYHIEMEEILKCDHTVSSIKLSGDISNLEKEKQKLTSILDRKAKLVEEEEQALKNLILTADMTKKRSNAQKLRLRNRIIEKRRLLQQIEQEAAVLQIEIDDIKSKK